MKGTYQGHDTPHHPMGMETKGVKTLLGEPKKAILKLAFPMIIAMSATTLYNVVDAFWVSGLGSNALAAIGFFFPFLFMAMAISIGLGIGGGSAISRRIGSKNKAGADSAAMHTLILMLVMTAVFTIPFIIFARPIFASIGAGDALDLTVPYAQIMFGGTVFIFFNQTANSILRAEGDANRAMYVMLLGAFLNIVLDPIFIYTLDLGVPGAAWATILSMGITSIPLAMWMFFKRDTYLSYHLRGFKWIRDDVKDIMKVGVPSMVMQLSMAITLLITNVIIVGIGGEDGVAIYSTGWRVVSFGILPLLGIATAVVSVTGAAFGAQDFIKLRTAYYYALKLGIVIGSVGGIATFILAPQISAAFTRSEDAAHIEDELLTFFKISCLFYPGAAAGIFSSSMFQGVGKGMNALWVTLLRTVILTTALTLIFAYPLDLGLVGIWWGIVIANLTASTIAFIWARYFVDCLIKSSTDRSEDAICSRMSYDTF